jgi:CBS domain containing-hemolysin-like protein
MQSWIGFEIFIISVLIILSAFFSGSETALISVNRIRIRHLADSGNKKAVKLLKLVENPEQFLTALLIGNNIVNVFASVLATDVALKVFGDTGLAIATGLMTLLILVFGEVFPKTLASRNAEQISLKIARPISVLILILKPVVRLLTLFTNFMILVLGGKERVTMPFVTEDTINLLLRVGEKEGTIETHEREFIHNVFEFSDETATGILTPKEKMVCIEENETLDSALMLTNESGHSRIPVYKKNFDNIVGMVYAKDFLKFNDTELKRLKAGEILRPIVFVKAERKISSIFKELQKKKINLSIVVDDNMKVIGLVSLEDILEEIVGEIFDEYDVETENGKPLVKS